VGAVVLAAAPSLGGLPRGAGEAHAEVRLWRKRGMRAPADLVSTLEPCAHQGRNPSLRRRDVKAGIRP